MTRIYLDHAATTPMVDAARQAMVDAFGQWANPSSVHTEGRAARNALESARRRVLTGLGAQPQTRLIFTSSASEALAIALGRAPVSRLIIGATEHDAVLRCAPEAPCVPVDPLGRLDIGILAKMLAEDDTPALVAVQHVNNETGVVQDIAAIADLVHSANGLLLVDVAQSAGKLPLPAADFLTISAHKLGGSPGIGALLLRNDRLIKPTGGQERGLRGGTENLPAILGFAAAVEALDDWAGVTAPLMKRLEQEITTAGGHIIAAEGHRVPWITAIRMPGVEAATQLMHFDLAGIAVSAGAACSSGSMKPSHVLAAMGYDADAAREVIRVSLAPQNAMADIERFIAAWRSLKARVGSIAA